MKLNLLIFTFLLIASQVFARGGQEGDGGGMICVNGRCVTIGEAGFRVVAGNAPIELETAVIAELKYLTDLLPPESFSEQSVIGNPGAIKFVETVDPKIVKQFLKKYHEVLEKNAAGNMQRDLEIAAFTVSNKTYVILDKYNVLNVRSKALLLIHEYLLREQRRDLTSALEFDGVLVDYINAVEHNRLQNFDFWHFLDVSFQLQGQPQLKFYHLYLIGDLLHRIGPMPVKALFSKCSLMVDSTVHVKLDYIKILENRKYDSRFTQYISPGESSNAIKFKPRCSLICDHFDKEAMPYKQATFSNEKFKKFVDDTYRQASSFEKKTIDHFRQCNNEDDRQNVVDAKEYGDSIFFLPIVVACGVNYYDVRDCQCNEFLDKVTPYLNGLELNMPGKLVCNWSSKTVGYNCRFVR